MLKELVLQFRANMLIATILIIMYAAIQKLFWKKDINESFVIETILNQFVLEWQQGS